MMAETGPIEIAWPYTHRLSKTVNTPGGEVSEIVLREPSTADLIDIGLLDGATGTSMFELVVKLSGKPEPTLKAVPGYDMLVLITKLSRFFNQASK